MKKLLFLLVLVSTLQAIAQDVIVKTDGSTILSKVLEVNTNDIKYKKHSNPKGPTYTINKSEVMSINYENGDKDLFSSKKQSDNRSITKNDNDIQTLSQEIGHVEDPETNQALITQYNTMADMLHYTDNPGKKPGQAKSLVAVMKVTPESKMTDGNVAVLLRVPLDKRATSFKEIWKDKTKAVIDGSQPTLIATVVNNSDNAVYLDLMNTFFGRNGRAEPYWVPQSTAVSSSSSSGVGVNLGAVAGAMGVGGSLGKLASGINVSGGSTQGATTVTYSQRVVPIPAHSMIELEAKLLFNNETERLFNQLITSSRSVWDGTQPLDILVNKSEIIHEGEERNIINIYPQLNWDFGLSYSFDENLSTVYKLNSKVYVDKLVGVHKTVNKECIKLDQLTDVAIQDDCLVFGLRQKLK